MSIGQTLTAGNERQMIRERDEALEALEHGLPGVSVVIPCFNQAEYLYEALESVREQTVQPLEVTVVDDGSDEPVEVVGWTFPTRVVRVANRGLPNARNTGLMLARGQWFLPLDADDWLDPHYIERTLAKAAEQPHADVIQVGLQEHGERTGTFMPGYDMPLSSVSDGALLHCNRLFYCALIRTRTLREAGGYNGRMINGWEDWDLWRDLMRRGVSFAGCDEVLFHYRVKAGSMAAITDRDWKEWNLMEMARHHV